MKKAVLLVVLGCMLSCAVPADSDTNTVDKLKVLEASFLDAMYGVDANSGHTNTAILKPIRRELGLLVSTLCDYPHDVNATFTDSDANVIEFVYSAYNGDLGHLQRTRKGNEALSSKVITHRVNSLISAYPLASQPQEKEHVSMVLFLAYASNTNADDVRTAARSALDRLTPADQVPFLVALSELGDKRASEALAKNVSTETDCLQSLFRRLHKGKDASKQPGNPGNVPESVDAYNWTPDQKVLIALDNELATLRGNYMKAHAEEARQNLLKAERLIAQTAVCSNTVDTVIPRMNRLNYARLYALERALGNVDMADIYFVKMKYWYVVALEMRGTSADVIAFALRKMTADDVVRDILVWDHDQTGQVPQYVKDLGTNLPPAYVLPEGKQR